MKNFLNKQKEIVAILVYVIIIASLFYFVVIPFNKRIVDKSNQIQEEALKEESMKKHLDDLPRIQQQYKTLQDGASSIDVLLDKNNAVILIEKLEKLAENTNNKITITVQDKAPEQVKAAPKAKTAADVTILDGLPKSDYLELKMNVVGKYDSIMNFIKILENFEYYSDIIGIQIAQNEKTAQVGGVSVSNSGMFGSSASVPAGNVTNNPISQNTDNLLSANLDTVFYTR